MLHSQTFYEEGYIEYKNGNYKKSIILFNSSIEVKQELAKSYMYKGAANIFLNNLEDSKLDLDTSYKLDSSNEQIFLYYGKYYLAIKEYKLSINYYDIAISKNVTYASAYAERAGAKCMLKEYDTALKDANMAIQLDSTNQVAYLNRGFIYINLKKYDEAIQDFNTSLKIKPNQKSYANKGFAYYKLKMYSLAIVNFTKSLEFNAEDSEVLYYRGEAYAYIGNYENACSDYIKSNSLVKNQSSIDALKRLKCN